MTSRIYTSPAAFKQALEQRLRASARGGIAFARQRQLLVFDRFLARVALVLGDSATLKGGLVLELRLERARTTNDVELRMVGSSDRVLERLQEAGRQDLGDFMRFELAPSTGQPEIPSSASPSSGLPRTFWLSQASHLPRSGSIPSRRTWPRSFTPTRCRASGRTHG